MAMRDNIYHIDGGVLRGGKLILENERKERENGLRGQLGHRLNRFG